MNVDRGPTTPTVESIVRAMEVTRDMEKEVKQEVAKGFWQHDVSAQRRPKHHRK